MCVPQKGASPQQLAAVREERSVGSLLQSGSDRDAAPRCRGGFLPGHGFLRGLLEMIELDRNRKDWMGAGWGWTHLSGHLIILDYVTDETPLPCGPM